MKLAIQSKNCRIIDKSNLFVVVKCDCGGFGAFNLPMRTVKTTFELKKSGT